MMRKMMEREKRKKEGEGESEGKGEGCVVFFGVVGYIKG